MRDDYDSEPETDADPQDYDETFHFLILTKLPPITSYPWSQAASGLYRGSSWDDIIGDEMSESERYWRDLQSPQSKPPRQGSEVCSSPTSSPHRPNMAPQPGNYVSMVRIKGCFVHPSWFLTTPSVSRTLGWTTRPAPTRLIVNTERPHLQFATTSIATHPPRSDSSTEGSRRTEIGSEVVRLPSPRSYTKEAEVSRPKTDVGQTSDDETDCGIVVQFTRYQSKSWRWL